MSIQKYKNSCPSVPVFRERNPSDPCLTVGLTYIAVYQICAVTPELQPQIELGKS